MLILCLFAVFLPVLPVFDHLPKEKETKLRESAWHVTGLGEVVKVSSSTS